MYFVNKVCAWGGMQNTTPHPRLSLITHFQDLPDPRVNRTKEHQLIGILVISVCTLLCGGEGFNDMEDFGQAKHDWFKTFLELPNGIPSHDTFNRVFRALDPGAFLECFIRWTQSLRAVHEEIVAMDGKALRRALKQGKGLLSVGVVESSRQAGEGPVTVERRYYLSSLAPEPQRFARAVRGHWAAENACHWSLDVSMGEDQSRARAGHVAQNLGTLRRLALNLLKRDPTKKRGIKGKQKNAGWDHSYLLRLLGVNLQHF